MWNTGWVWVSPGGEHGSGRELCSNHKWVVNSVRVTCGTQVGVWVSPGGEHGSAEAPPEHTEDEEEHDGEGRVLAQQGLCVQVARLRDATTA